MGATSNAKEIIAEYEAYNKNTNEVVGAMAYTIGRQRRRIEALKQRIEELSQQRAA